MGEADAEAPRLEALKLGAEASAWRGAGFEVRGRTFTAGGVTCHLDGSTEERGILGWQLTPPAAKDIDGLATAEMEPRATTDEHPNGVIALDHVVVATDDLERTTAALATIGVEPRRTVVGAQGDDRTAFRFFLLGTCVLEVIGPTERDPASGSGSASFVGLAFTTTSIDDLGNLAPPPRPAVQPGRRITTLDHEALGLGIPVALLSPRPRG